MCVPNGPHIYEFAYRSSHYPAPIYSDLIKLGCVTCWSCDAPSLDLISPCSCRIFQSNHLPSQLSSVSSCPHLLDVYLRLCVFSLHHYPMLRDWVSLPLVILDCLAVSIQSVKLHLPCSHLISVWSCLHAFHVSA